jgi:hypothetical protein
MSAYGNSMQKTTLASTSATRTASKAVTWHTSHILTLYSPAETAIASLYRTSNSYSGIVTAGTSDTAPYRTASSKLPSSTSYPTGLPQPEPTTRHHTAHGQHRHHHTPNPACRNPTPRNDNRKYTAQHNSYNYTPPIDSYYPSQRSATPERNNSHQAHPAQHILHECSNHRHSTDHDHGQPTTASL